MKMILSLVAIVCFSLAGCNKSGSDPSVAEKSPSSVAEDHSSHDHSEHAHADHGPHGGDIVELGKEEFHAELAHGDDGISIYVLDSLATNPVAIATEKLMVSLKHDGEVKSFEMAANPDTGDAAGQASRFTSADPNLDEWLDAGAEGAVTIEIEGKSYTGKIAHDHDHAGHDH